MLGDLRRLPFADGAFGKGYALDVFEHLSREALAEVLAEIARVMRPGGQVFVYSHVRKNSWLAGGLKAVNRLARQLERVGLVDLRQERLRKSDHLNPLADIPDLERVVGDAGFGIARIRYYTPLIGAFVENILMRMAERALARGGSAPSAPEGARPSAAGGSAPHGVEGGALRRGGLGAWRRRGGRALARRARRQSGGWRARGPLYYTLKGVTALMTLDVWSSAACGRGRSSCCSNGCHPRARVGRPTDDPKPPGGRRPARRWSPLRRRPGGTIHGAGVVAGRDWHSR